MAGTVFVHQLDGVTPAASGSVFGWIEKGNGGRTTGRISIGADGRYEFVVPHDTTRVHVKGPSYQPCAVSVAIAGDVTLDVHNVVDPRLLGANLPAELSSRQPTVSGMAYEQTPDGRRPLPNVVVMLDGINGDNPIASTLTDAEGRYVLCGVPPIPGLLTWGSLAGYKSFLSLNDLGTTRDIEMRRCMGDAGGTPCRD